jgi:hypothetical protein
MLVGSRASRFHAAHYIHVPAALCSRCKVFPAETYGYCRLCNLDLRSASTEAFLRDWTEAIVHDDLREDVRRSSY